MKRAVGAAAMCLGILAMFPGVSQANLIPVDPVLNGGFELCAADVPPDTPVSDDYADCPLFWGHSSIGNNVEFRDLSGDGDVEAVIPANVLAAGHNFWQATFPTMQAFTANFTAFEFVVEAGTVPSKAAVEIGLGLSPTWHLDPHAGIWWDGAIRFDAADMNPTGFQSLNPVTQGEVICPPNWDPCEAFAEDFALAGPTQRAELLGQARLVQLSFWYWARTPGPGLVAIDDVSIDGATSFVEEPLPCRGETNLDNGVHVEYACVVHV